MATTNIDNSDIVIAIYDNTWEFLDFNGLNALWGPHFSRGHFF